MNLLLAQQVTIRKPGLPLNFGIRACSATVFRTSPRSVSHFRSKTLQVHQSTTPNTALVFICIGIYIIYYRQIILHEKEVS